MEDVWTGRMPYGRWSMLFILTWYVADGNRRSHNGIHMNDVDRRRGIGLDQSSESTPPSLSSNCVTSVVWTELDFVRLHFPRSAELVRGMISWAFQINSTLREMSKMARHLFDRTTTWEAVHFLWRWETKGDWACEVFERGHSLSKTQCLYNDHKKGAYTTMKWADVPPW